MIFTKIGVGLGIAASAAALLWLNGVNSTITNQSETIDALTQDKITLENNVATLSESYDMQINALAEDRQRFEDTLAIHSQYLSRLRRDATKWVALEAEIRELEGQNETASDFLITAGRKLWPTDEQSPDSGPDDTANLPSTIQD